MFVFSLLLYNIKFHIKTYSEFIEIVKKISKKLIKCDNYHRNCFYIVIYLTRRQDDLRRADYV